MYNISLSGYKRSGKDYIGNYFKNRIVNSEIVKFATPIYNVAQTLFKIKLEEIEKSADINIKENTLVYRDKSLRYFLQTFGDEYIRKFMGEEFWIDYFIKENKNLLENNLAIITDTRYTDEFYALDKFSFIKILVKNSNINNIETHRSEKLPVAENEFDFIFDNTERGDLLPIHAISNDQNKINFIRYHMVDFYYTNSRGNDETKR